MTVARRVHGIFILFLVIFFLTYDQLVRAAPKVLRYEVIQNTEIGGEILGVMGIVAIYVYILLVIPVGMLFDQVKSKVLLPLAITSSALGLFFLGWSYEPVLALIAKALLIVSAPFSFLSVLILTSRWFSHRHFAMITGVAQLFLTLGILLAGIPVAFLVEYYVSWRVVMVVLGSLGIVLILMCLMIIQDSPMEEHLRLGGARYKRELRKVFHSKQMWASALYIFCGWGPILVFATEWGGAFIHKKCGVKMLLSRDAMAILWLSVGVLAPFMGYLSDRIKKRRSYLVALAGLGLVSSLLLVYGGKSFPLMILALVGMGIAGAGQVITYAYVKDLFPNFILGFALGIAVMASVLGGLIVDFYTQGVFFFFHTEPDGLFSVHAYRIALSIHPFLFLVALITAVFFLRETGCRSPKNGEASEADTGASNEGESH